LRPEPEPEPEPNFARAQARAQAPDIDLGELKQKGTNAGYLAVGLTSIFHGLALSRGPHWRLRNDEALYLATDLDGTLKQLLPEQYLEAYNEILAKCAPIIGLCVSATAIIGQRLAIDAELNATKTKPDSAHQQTSRHAGAGAGDRGPSVYAGSQTAHHSGPVHDAGFGDFGPGFVGAW